jgi:hypothetical protein
MRRDAVTPAEEVWLKRALTVIRFVRHPAFPGLVVMAGLALAGFAGIILAWYGTSGTLFVALQIPHLVSGGLGGLALVGAGIALLHIQMGRREAAIEEQLTDDILDEVAALVALAPKLRELRQSKTSL